MISKPENKHLAIRTQSLKIMKTGVFKINFSYFGIHTSSVIRTGNLHLSNAAESLPCSLSTRDEGF